MRGLGPVSFLSLLVISAPAAAQTGELFWDGARHRFETEQGFAEVRSFPPPECTDPVFGADPTFCDHAPFDTNVYYLAQYGARVRVFEDETLDVSGLLAIDLQAAWRIGAVEDVGLFGPLLLGAHVAWIAPELVARGGLAVGAPVHELLNDMSWAEEHLLLAPYGHGEPWLARAAVPIVLQLSVEGRHEWIFGGIDAGGAILVSESYVGQAAVFAGVRPIQELALGMRGLVVYEHPVERWAGSSPEEYFSITTFVRLDTRPFFAEVRWLLNLDEPYGRALDDGATWSLRALLGWETD